jgi:hypothetical protein
LLFTGLAFLLVPPARSAVNDTANDPKGPAPTAGPGVVEVRFVNGSTVMMTLLQDKLEIQTAYGKLIIPPGDIRRIEFGRRISEEDARKVEQAIRCLSSTSYKERELAVRDLVALGPVAYSRLQSVIGGQDLEASKRGEAALMKIREKFSTRLLCRSEEDIVQTAKFTIVGRVLTPAIKAKAEDFGELELRPAKLLAIRRLQGDVRKEVVVNAAVYAAPDGRKWLDSGVVVEPRMSLKFSATGQVDLTPQQPGNRQVGPDGLAGTGGGGRVMMRRGKMIRFESGEEGGELMGRIGKDGTPFFIGSQLTQTSKTTGKLYLQITPSPWGGASSGEFRVAITTGSFPVESDDDE